MLQHCVPREVVLSVDFDFVCVVVLLIFISVIFFLNSFLPYLRLTVKIFQFLQLSTKFWAVLRLSVNPGPLRPSLTRPGVKLDEKVSICSSTPQVHMVYTNSNQSSIGFDNFFFFSVGRIRLCRLPNLIEPYCSTKFSI